METIKVTGCIGCPFLQTEWNPDSVGSDTLLSCNLYGFGSVEYKDNIIACYDSYDDNQDPIVTPEWCPLTEIQITKL